MIFRPRYSNFGVTFCRLLGIFVLHFEIVQRMALIFVDLMWFEVFELKILRPVCMKSRLFVMKIAGGCEGTKLSRASVMSTEPPRT